MFLPDKSEIIVQIIPKAFSNKIRMRFLKGELKIHAPKSFTQKNLPEFLFRNYDWLKAQLAKNQNAPKIFDGAKIDILGVANFLVSKKIKNENCIIIRVGNRGFIEAAQRKLRQIARIEAQKIINEIEKNFALKANRLAIKDTISRWGSCSNKDNINLSYRLIFAPYEVFFYVIAHEMAHLIHKNHGKEFWNLVEKICPDYKTQRKWLRDNGASLHKIS